MKISSLANYCRRVYAFAVEVGAIRPGQIRMQPGDLGAVSAFVAIIKAVPAPQAQMLLTCLTRNDTKNEN